MIKHTHLEQPTNENLWSKLASGDGEPVNDKPRKADRPDLNEGDIFVVKVENNCEGEKFVKKQAKVKAVLPNHYQCELKRNDGSTYTECFLKVDYRFGIGVCQLN